MDEQKEEAIFHEALQLPPEKRAAYLALACAGDPSLRNRIERLLQAQVEADPFFSKEPLGIALGDSPPNQATIVLVTEKPGDRIGRYKLLQQIGEGGCGVVYMAEQEEPVRRRVALKVIKLGMDTKSVIARFEAERQALALMDHPNIAKVLDAGATETGRPYFVMELVRGIKITEYCDQNNLSTRERLGLFMQVCHAIQHAHQKGIIHRDIKPSNILISLQDGVPVPVVIDFGIAKATEQRLTDKTLFTAFEQFIGTPAYTSPEQAEMSRLDIDTRSDIYALGVLLYELLTGNTPFDSKMLLGVGMDEMRRTIREQEPLRPSTRLGALPGEELTTTAKRRGAEALKLIHLVQGDLDWIVMKCLEKDRRRRYETANGLALDIERHLKHEPVIARPPSTVYRAQKFIRRNKVVVGAAGLVAAALVLGILVSTWQAVRASRLRVRAEANEERALLAQANEAEQRQAAETAQASEARLRQQAEAEAYAADINLAQQAIEASDVGRAKQLLEAYAAPSKQHLRGWEWRYLWQQCQSEALGELCRYSNTVNSVTFAPDGRLLALAGFAPGFAELWDVHSRKRIASLPTDFGQMIVFSPRGDLLAACAGVGGLIRVWQTGAINTFKEITHPDTYPKFPSFIRALKFSPDGTRLASLSWPGEVAIWDVGTWTIVRRIPGARMGEGDSNDCGALDFSPDGKALVVGGADRRARVVDLETGSEGPKALIHPDPITALAWSPKVPVIASGTGFSSGLIRLWDAVTGNPLGTLEGHTSWVSELIFSADGQRLYSASADQTIRIWDVRQQRSLGILRGSTDLVCSLALSPDGTMLASGSADGVVDLWSTQAAPKEGQPRLLLLGPYPGDPILWPAFAPDNRAIAAPRGGTVSLFDLATGKEIEQIPALGSNIAALAYSPDGKLLASANTNCLVRVWSCAERRLVAELTGHAKETVLLAFAGGGNRLLSVDFGEKAIVWDVGTWQAIRSYALEETPWAIALSPDGRLLVTGHVWGKLKWWNAETGRLLATTVGHRNPVNGIAFSPDGTQVASAGNEGTITLWDVFSFKRIASFRAHTAGSAGVTFSPDGQRLATGNRDREAIKLWDLATRRELVTLRGQSYGFYYLAFSPDGNWLAGCNWSPGQLHLWHAPPMTDIDSAAGRAK